MSNSAFVRLIYQANEEVLETGVWYFNLEADPLIDPDSHIDFCNDVAQAAVTNWTSTWGDRSRFWGCSVEVPIQPDGINGPYRFMRSEGHLNEGGGDMGADLAIARITIRGLNALLKPVEGGIRMSGAAQTDLDCNTWDQQFLDVFGAWFDVVFPRLHTVTSGATFQQVIKHKAEGQPFPEYVPVTSSTVQPRVTTRQDRVLNKTPYKISPTVPEPATP